MKFRISILLLLALLFAAGSIFISCSKSRSDYKSGLYWLNEKNNPRQAVHSFQRALEGDPDSWKIHAALIDAMVQSNADPVEFEKQIRQTLSIFPDSARSASLAKPGMKLLGEDKYNKLSSLIEMQHLSSELARNPQDIELLSRCIMASCRMKDTLGVEEYFKRALNATGGTGVPDTVVQEMQFFIGSANIDWLELEWRIDKNPNDNEARLEQIKAGILLGDSSQTVKKIKELYKKDPSVLSTDELAIRYGRLVGYNPFPQREITRGWDGDYFPNGKKIVFVKNMGDDDFRDLYFYEKPTSGGAEQAVLKAYQQSLDVLAWPKMSPDGKWIYFYGSKDKEWKPGIVGKFHLYRVKPSYNSRPVRLSDADLLTVEPYFKSDDKLLLVRRDLGSVRSSVEVVELNAEDSSIDIISRIGEPVSGATFTTNGDSLILITDRGIFRRAVEGGKITVDLTWVGMSFPQLSPDGKLLKLVNPAGQIIILNRKTGKIIFLGNYHSSSHITFGKSGKILFNTFEDNQDKLVELNLTPRSVDKNKFISKIKN